MYVYLTVQLGSVFVRSGHSNPSDGLCALHWDNLNFFPRNEVVLRAIHEGCDDVSAGDI